MRDARRLKSRMNAWYGCFLRQRCTALPIATIQTNKLMRPKCPL